MALNKEQKLTARCANLKQTAAITEEISWLIRQKPDWQKVVAEAISQGVASLVYYNLSRLKTKQPIPLNILNELKTYYLDTMGRNIVLFEELKKAMLLLQQEEINTVVLKGPALVATTHKNWGLRWIGDIDLLVPIDDIFKAKECLADHGYVNNKKNKSVLNDDISRHHHLQPLWNIDSSIRIELHWSLTTSKLYEINLQEIWDRVTTGCMDDIDLLVLSPEDMLLHFCVHHCYGQVKHIYYKFVYDIAVIIQYHGRAINWSRFVKNIIKYKTSAPVLIGLNLAKQLFGVDIPTNVFNILEAHHEDSQLMYFNIRKAYTGKSSVVELLENENLPAKIRFVWQKFFPSIESLSVRFSTPRNSKFIYFLYLVRPVQLLKDHTLIALKLLFIIVSKKIKSRTTKTRLTPMTFLHHSNTE